MKHLHSFLCLALVVPFALDCIEADLYAQSLWANPGRQQSLSVEFLKPKLDGNEKVPGLTAAMFISGYFRLSEFTNLVLELPIARSKPNTQFSVDKQTMFGNPYIGLELRSQHSSNFFEFGIRPPLASDRKPFAAAIGIRADYDRLEAFLPNQVVFSGKLNDYKKGDSGGFVWLRFGPTATIPTKGGDGELFLDYSGLMGFEGVHLLLSFGITGRFLVTQDGGNFGERSSHQFGGTASLRLGNLMPGVHYRIPLDDDLKAQIDSVFGLTFNILLD